MNLTGWMESSAINADQSPPVNPVVNEIDQIMNTSGSNQYDHGIKKQKLSP